MTSGLSDEAILEDFLGHFGMLAAVPRGSGNERAVSDRLKAWAEGLGFAVRQNAVWNLVFDVPATPGLEELPLTALQAHLDMVCSVREGRAYDPARDAITPIADRAAGTLRADGMTLGADDGAGVAVIMGIAEGKMAHGPLRVLLTADEERGMSGALAVTAEDLRGVKRLVNLDSEEGDAVTVSSAEAIEFYATAGGAGASPLGSTALRIALAGAAGGHSGMEIGDGKCNGIVALAETLSRLGGEVAFELARFGGGTANNAIPAKAEAVVVVETGERAKVREFVDARETELRAVHAETDSGLSLRVEEAPMPGAVMAGGAAAGLLRYATESINGVHTMSRAMEGLVESSSNLGRLEAGPEGIRCVQMARSSDAGKLREIEAFQRALAAECGLAFEASGGAKAWPVKPDSELVPRLREVYRGLTGKELRVTAVHAGLECGVFAELDGSIDIVSIGPDISFAHSPDETLWLGSVPLLWRLLEGVLGSQEGMRMPRRM
jgi:dipeptidase D